MNLEYIYVDGYKGLKQLSVSFEKQNSPVGIHFFIGKNGSGKSTLLEAVGLIFSTIARKELPGFPFTVKYSMPDGAEIQVMPAGMKKKRKYEQKLLVQVKKGGEVQTYDRIPPEYLPDWIVSYCSGSNNTTEEILTASSRDSLISDLYDLAEAGREDQRGEKANELLYYYDLFQQNPGTLYLDASAARLILPVFFALLPVDLREREAKKAVREYCGLREMIVDRLRLNLRPVAFSLRIDEEKLKDSGDLPQLNLLRQILREDEKGQPLYGDYMTRGKSGERLLQDGSPALESTVVFLYRNYLEREKNSVYHEKLQKLFDGDPFAFLSVLLTGHREGIIKEMHFTFQTGRTEGLLELEALSDGELMWIARMGLILMAQKCCGENILFLYDEPDVHFNDDWNQDFIKLLYRLSEGTQHEFLIATHSTLLLTDAEYEQLGLLENREGGPACVKNIRISTFAAQRDEISKQVFGAEAIGAYAKDTVRNMMREENPERMMDNIAKLGPGYERFRLYERYYSMEEERG